MMRKVVAFVLAYACFASSVWSLALPGVRLGTNGSPIGNPLLHVASAGAKDLHPLSGSLQRSSAPQTLASVAAMNGSIATAQVSGGGTTTTFFGPQQYARTTGDPNTYTTTVQVPAWVVNPFNLHVQNGEADGSFRVSSATISVNNLQVAGPSDFNQNVFTLDRSVTLTPTTTLAITLASKPGSYLRINLAGVNGDHTPPAVTIAAPATAINTPQAHFDIQYKDLPGTGEPAASGVNTTTLQVLIDGVDRTSLFTVRSDEATADLPASLALGQGPHQVTASIQDNAGNTGQATVQFQVDTTPPTLQIVQPVAGSYLKTATPQIQLAYSDNFALNLSSLKVTVNGTDYTSLFTKTATGATATLPALPQRANQMIATISDQAGNPVTASIVFNVDTTPPVISIVHPATGSTHGSATVEYLIQYSDDQLIDLTSLTVTVDGNPVPATAAPSSASGSVTLADNANHVLSASIKDKAGNLATTSSTFSVDTTAPNVHIVQPVPGAILNASTPQIQVQYDDNENVNLSSFRFTIDGTDVTALFSVGPTSASANLQSPLAEGTHALSAQIADSTGNIGQASSQIFIDTIRPQLSIVSPSGAVNTAAPSALAQYSDSGSGIDPKSVHVTLDGIDVTSTFSVASDSTTGILGAGGALSESTHQFAVTVADKAGNVAQASSSFLVDVTPPSVTFLSPANNSFTNNTQPSLVLNYQDSGSGVDPTSIHVFLQQGNAAETEITSLFALGPVQATATIPAGSPLAAATYHLRAVVGDRAGNQGSANSAFAVDTTAPVCTIQAPAANQFLNTATPALTVSCQDDSSGIDPTKFVVQLDGVDVTSQMSATSTGISGTFSAVADGTHQIQVQASDRAGNPAPALTEGFLVDTTPPTISIISPANASQSASNPPAIAVTFADGGSGIDVTTFTLLIDGADHTAEFTTTAAGATGTPVVALAGGAHVITATVKDLAGNTNSATTTFSVTTAPLQISITQPASGTYTNANSITISGNVSGGVAPVTVTVEGGNAPVQGSTFSATTALGAGPTQVIHVSATDGAGGSSSATVTVNIDRVNPTIIGSIVPAPNAAGWNNSNVTVNFACSDDNSGVATCSGPVPVTTEGANQIVTGTATDKAGNTAQTSVTVKIDKTPPLVTATAAPPANAAGWNNSNVTVTFTCSDSLSGVASCPASPTVVASEGQNQLISGQATDVAGNVATASVSLSIDKTAPTIVQLSTPSQISPLHGGQVSVTASDNFTVTQVVISVNGSPLGTFTSAPYQANLTVPAGANPGDTLTVTAVATDQAGNTQTASRGVIVAADGGVIVGQVLDDGTSFPVQNASVQVISATGLLDQTDDHGRYSLQVADSHLFVTFTAPAAAKPTTNVEREVFVQLGVGTVPVDARLTTLGDPVTISSSGGTLSSGTVSVSVPAGAAVAGSAFRLTYLSGQGLPGLLPLGWSPLAAFDLRSTSSASGLSASVTSLPNVVAHLVTYDFSLHAWTMLAQNLQPVNGAFSFTLPGTGAFALVTPDTLDPPLPLPDVGSPLSGVPVQMLSPSATSSGSLNPATLPPSGGTALATLGVQSPTPLLSGTVIQANISETFSLASGDVVSEETRSEDIVLYNALAPATSSSGAVFPVSPSHHYSNAQLLTGKVHLDILAGREGVRGQPGGNDPVTVSDGTATLSVPGGALSQDTAISVVSTSLEDFVPTSSTLSALQEILVDFSGEMLSTPAQLSISAAGLNPAHTFLLTQVQRITGVPHIVAVAVAQVNGSNLTSVASPGLPGVIRGGEYIFYDVAAPAGFIQGVAASSAGPVPVLVGTDSLQIVNITGADGRYIVPALAGTVNLRANGTTSSVTGTASTQLTAGQTATVNIQLNGTVNTATISPADQSLGVSVSTIITVTSPVPLDPKSIVQNNLLLVKGTSSAPGAPVALQPFILSTSGTTLTFAPVQNLDAAAQYTAQVTGLADMGGGAIVVPTSTFTTKANQPLTFDPNAITFGFPDQNGNIHVSAPAGSLSSGTKVLIVDQTNAVVLSITAFNDGSLSGDFPGTINDVLQVTVTDPNGATASFTRSQFVAPDGSVAVGPGGGTVTGPGGLSMVIPEGALTQGAVFSLKPLGADAFPQLPNFPGATFGGGMQINTPSMPAFKKEVKLSFSKPADAPDGGLAFYYVYRQLTDQNGNVYFETIDHAFAQGTGSSAQVVTASPPFCGYVNSYGNFNAVASASFVPSVAASNNIFLVWERVQNALNPSADPNQPGIGSQGLIVGRALQTVPPGPGQTEPTFTPLAGATVWIGSGDSPGQNVAITSDACGTFTIFDPQLGGGLRTISAISPNGGPTMHATAEEVNGVQTDDQTYLITEGLENTYRNIGRVTLTFSPVAPPPPPSQVDIRMFTLNSQNLRIPSGGIVQVGVPLVIAVKSGLSVTSGNVAGVQLSAQSPDHLDNIQDTQPTLDARLYDPSSTNQTYTPTTAGSYTLTVTGVSPLGGP
ncbi:MAG TPA: Ig-like domain-containing protein, partial [Candidatus Angelobacter sp.]